MGSGNLTIYSEVSHCMNEAPSSLMLLCRCIIDIQYKIGTMSNLSTRYPPHT